VSTDTKPTVPEVLPLVNAYYRTHPVGGSLHIVLDDCNVGDSSVEFCLNHAIEDDDAEGEALARILLRMSKTQRKRLYQLHD
jgi:hypothetical protein